MIAKRQFERRAAPRNAGFEYRLRSILAAITGERGQSETMQVVAVGNVSLRIVWRRRFKRET
jgi:hypothetical protein